MTKPVEPSAPRKLLGQIPEIVDFWAVSLMLGEQYDDWMEIVCPECECHTGLMVRKSTIVPDYLFECNRTVFIDLGHRERICHARWSICKEKRA